MDNILSINVNKENKKYPCVDCLTDYINIKIPQALADKIDIIIAKRIQGYRSRGEIVNECIRQKIREIEDKNSLEPYNHYNVFEDHATVKDYTKKGMEIDVFFRNGKPFCDYCKKSNCEHIHFLLNKEEFQKILKDKGY